MQFNPGDPLCYQKLKKYLRDNNYIMDKPAKDFLSCAADGSIEIVGIHEGDFMICAFREDPTDLQRPLTMFLMNKPDLRYSLNRKNIMAFRRWARDIASSSGCKEIVAYTRNIRLLLIFGFSFTGLRKIGPHIYCDMKLII